MPTKLTTRQKDKLIEAAQNAVTFQVTGTGQFPFDMLRYDLCWPAGERDSNMLAMVGQRTMTLKGLKVPTAARWNSYGWKVVEG